MAECPVTTKKMVKCIDMSSLFKCFFFLDNILIPDSNQLIVNYLMGQT